MIKISIIITARTGAGQAALSKYFVEKLTIRERVMAKAAGVSEKRSWDLTIPFSVRTDLELTGKAEEAVSSNMAYWRSENEKVVKTKMAQLGASEKDYALEVL